ncbi:MAG: type II/IV secretion system ATPase subunit [Dehalococcoidia bacterium]
MKEIHSVGENLSQCGVYTMVPENVKKVFEKNPFFLRYMHLIPIERIGVPDYYETPTRDLGDLPQPNLIYPLTNDCFVHIYPDPEDMRQFYIPIEPSFTIDVDHIVKEVEKKLLDFTEELEFASSDEDKEKALLNILDSVCVPSTKRGDKNNGERGALSLSGLFRRNNNDKVFLTPEELEAVKYLIVRDKVGLGVLEPFIRDPYIEDISCSGLGRIFVEHKIFKGLKSTMSFASHEDLDDFVLRLAEKIKKPVTVHNPVADATLPDGSRINIVYGTDVSKRGSNFTIRKFMGTPISIVQLVDFGTMDYMAAAYLSLVIEGGMNLFVSGETASGKTTTMNALTTFIPPEDKIVSIEDTPELQVPHHNWIREVATAGGGGTVSMFGLLKAALRQRPDMIIIGEIRGEEGNIAFQAMQTGHACMSTFHAASVEKLIQRLTGDPIKVPKMFVDNLNVVVIQSAVQLANGKTARRVLSISEIVGFDVASQAFSFVDIFNWESGKDKLRFVGNMNSYLLEEKVAMKRGYSREKRREIYKELKQRAKILERLHKEKGVTDFYDLLQVISAARRQGVF